MCLTPGLARAAGEGAGRAQVAHLEAGLAAGHGVRQVVGRVHALEGRRQRLGVEQVDPYDLGLGEALLQSARVAAGQAQRVALGCQQRHQPATDVAAGADDEDAHRVSRSLGRLGPAAALLEGDLQVLGHARAEAGLADARGSSPTCG